MNKLPTDRPAPPRFAESLLTRLLPRSEVGECILGDLRQEYAELFRVSRRSAHRWYWLQTFSLGWRYGLAKLSQAARTPSRIRQGSMNMTIPMGTLIQDVRFATRSFVKRPGFSLAVIAFVALGVGATTTIYSVVDNVLLKKLPYPDSEQLVWFERAASPVPPYRELHDRTSSFSLMGAIWHSGFDITGDGTPENTEGGRVTEDYFRLLGARPLLGRMFMPDDFVGTPARVVTISHGLWQRRWGSDPDIVGRTVILNGSPVEIVGVVNPDFVPPVGSTAELWIPLDVMTENVRTSGIWTLEVIAQLRPGATLDVAQADVDRLSLELAEEYPNTQRSEDGSPRVYPVIPLIEATVGDVGNILWMLLGAVGLLLLIACANVANLFLARGTDRRSEIALRAALGAKRGRLVAQLLTESVLLALVGGAFGVVLAVLGVRAFDLYSPGGIPRVEDIGIDMRVLGFALVLSVATGVVFGLVPAMKAARSDVRKAMDKNAPDGMEGRGPISLRSTLVVAEIAMALMLLVGGGLLFRSFVTLSNVHLGFDPENVMVMPLTIGGQIEGEERISFAEDLLERIAGIPGVERAGAGTTVPPNRGCCWGGDISIEEQAQSAESFSTIGHPITSGYFESLDARILRGRNFTEVDDDVSMGSVIINESVASYLFGEADPVGQSLWFSGLRLNVVGVVNDIRHWRLSGDGEYNIYVPFAAHGERFRHLQLAVRSTIDPTLLAETLRETVWSIDGDQPVGEIMRLEEKVARSITQPRFLSILLLTFAGLSILLAAGGIYGSVLYSVGQRKKEMGIRMALGAGTGNVVGMILRNGAFLTLTGLALGLGGAFALSRTLESLLFGITPTDPATFVVVSLLLGAVAMAACYVPARRATDADPIETLRAE